MKIGKDEGATLVSGGRVLDSGAYAKGFFHEPTVFGDVDPKMRIAREEIFGPVVSVMPCRSLEQAIEIGNDVEYGLSASIYTQDVNRAFTAMRDLYTGIFYVNAPTIGAEVHLPFGGTKNTGNGHREAGHRGARRVLGMEVDLHRLQRQAPAGANRRRGGLARLLVLKCHAPQCYGSSYGLGIRRRLYATAGLLSGYPARPAAIWLYGIGVLIPAASARSCAIVRRSRDWAGSQWMFWATIAAGFSLWVIGHVGSAIERLTEEQPLEWLSWHTTFSLCGGIAPLLALLARPQRGPRARRARDDGGRYRGLRDHHGVRLRVLHHRAERGAGPRRFGTACTLLVAHSGAAVRAARGDASVSGWRTMSPPGGARSARLAAGYGVGF